MVTRRFMTDRPYGAAILAALHAGRRSGYFGSIDGDSAAAMRYTEIRLRKLPMN